MEGNGLGTSWDQALPASSVAMATGDCDIPLVVRPGKFSRRERTFLGVENCIDMFKLRILSRNFSLTHLRFLKETNSEGAEILNTLGDGSYGSIYLAYIPTWDEPSGLWLVSSSNHPLSNAEKKMNWYERNAQRARSSNKYDELVGPEQSSLVLPVLVAVKKLDISENATQEVLREATSLEVLWGARNVVPVLGIVHNREVDARVIVMGLVRGLNLNRFLQSYRSDPPFKFVEAGATENDRESRRLWRKDKTLWWKKKLEIFRELVLGLMFCHENGVYHGDLKGENVLLDKFLVPKLVDFGMSFAKESVWYFTIGGSGFWVSPELLDICDSNPLDKILEDPFPSDIYSLGMVLVELFLDGNVPDNLSEDFLMNKFLGGSPVSLELADDSDETLDFFKLHVLNDLEDLVNSCCCAEREDRISLSQCFIAVDRMYACICEHFCSCPGARLTFLEAQDLEFVSSLAYRQRVEKFETQFPDVLKSVTMQPSKNMVTDAQGNLLIHSFCKLDFMEGVKYIMESGDNWDFQPRREVLQLMSICVKEESISVLKYLAQTWRDQLPEGAAILVHEACIGHNAEVLRILLFDADLDFDTILDGAINQNLKPIHRLASAGKHQMIDVILERSGEPRKYVNTVSELETTDAWSASAYQTPLHVAVELNLPATVEFLLERGGVIDTRNSHPLLFYLSSKVVGLTTHPSAALNLLICHFGSFHVAERILQLGHTFDDDHVFLYLIIVPSCSNMLFRDMLEDLLHQHLDEKKFWSRRYSNGDTCFHRLAQLWGRYPRSSSPEYKDSIEEALFVEKDGLFEGKMFLRQGFSIDLGLHGNLSNDDLLMKSHKCYLVQIFFAYQMTVQEIAREVAKKFEVTSLYEIVERDILQATSTALDARHSIGDLTKADGYQVKFSVLKIDHRKPHARATSADLMDVGFSGPEMVSESGNVDDQHVFLPLSRDEPESVKINYLALENAVENGDSEEVSRLLSYRALEGLSSTKILELVKKCCRKGNLQALQLLHKFSSVLDIRCHDNHHLTMTVMEASISLAAIYGHVDMVKFLLESGMPTEYPKDDTADDLPKFPATPLLEAIGHQHVEVMEILLQAGADVHAVDDHNTTAMDRAAGHNNKKMIALLIEYGFDTGRRDRDGITYSSVLAELLDKVKGNSEEMSLSEWKEYMGL